MNTTDRPSHVTEDRVYDFDMYAPPGVKADFHAAWCKLQEPGVPDIVWTPRNDGHWIPTRAAIIREVMTDHSRFSNSNIIIPRSHSEDHDLLPTTIDPPEHHFYKLTLAHSMSHAAIAEIEQDIRRMVVELIEGFRVRGSCDVIREYAEILPIRVFLSMMDIPDEDRPQLKYWSDQTVRPDGSMSFAEAMQHLKDYVAGYVDRRYGGDGTDMLSRLINTEVDGRRMTREEGIKLVVQVFIGGLDTVVNLLGFVFLFLARNADHRRQLLDGSASLNAAVEEILRRFPLVTIAREVREDVVFHGAHMKKGEMVCVATPLAGVDDQFNTDPLRIDFHRGRSNSLTFGSGAHICPGRNLARTELRITLEEWLQRIPEFRVADGCEPTFSGGIVGVVDQLQLCWDT